MSAASCCCRRRGKAHCPPWLHACQRWQRRRCCCRWQRAPAGGGQQRAGARCCCYTPARRCTAGQRLNCRVGDIRAADAGRVGHGVCVLLVSEVCCKQATRAKAPARTSQAQDGLLCMQPWSFCGHSTSTTLPPDLTCCCQPPNGGCNGPRPHHQLPRAPRLELLTTVKGSRRQHLLGGGSGAAAAAVVLAVGCEQCGLRRGELLTPPQIARSARGQRERSLGAAQGATPGAQAGGPKPLGGQSQIVQLAAARGCAQGRDRSPGRAEGARAARSPTWGLFWGACAALATCLCARSKVEAPQAGLLQPAVVLRCSAGDQPVWRPVAALAQQQRPTSATSAPDQCRASSNSAACRPSALQRFLPAQPRRQPPQHPRLSRSAPRRAAQTCPPHPPPPGGRGGAANKKCRMTCRCDPVQPC